MEQEIIAGLLVAAAVVWFIRGMWRRVKSGGCACGETRDCPHAGRGDCPSASASAPDEDT